MTVLSESVVVSDLSDRPVGAMSAFSVSVLRPFYTEP